eukprot:Tamp_27115.p1 GENE.Tamp_27115~~Tamp_27115.p1  ORF type:complete len:148 (+),score=18.13 Tamp_27115:231-674(+)
MVVVVCVCVCVCTGRSVGAKLDMTNLCDYLAGEKFGDRVFKVSHVRPKGNSARFNNLSLYIRRECLTTWKDDGSDQTTVYVNVYETGKCSVLAAPGKISQQVLAFLHLCRYHTRALTFENVCQTRWWLKSSRILCVIFSWTRTSRCY